MSNSEDIEMRESLAKAIARLPEKTYAWSDNSMSESKPWGSKWVDIWIPEICEAAGLGWILTIVSEEEFLEKHAGDPNSAIDAIRFGEIGLPFDSFVRYVFTDKPYPIRVSYEAKGEEPFAYNWMKENGFESEDDIDPFSAADCNYYKNSDVFESEMIGGEKHVFVPVWSPENISLAVQDWIESQFGRKLDIAWESKQISPRLKEAKEIYEQIKNGAETYDLGNGVRASSQIMDKLAADPEQAAEITKAVKGLKDTAENSVEN